MLGGAFVVRRGFGRSLGGSSFRLLLVFNRICQQKLGVKEVWGGKWRDGDGMHRERRAWFGLMSRLLLELRTSSMPFGRRRRAGLPRLSHTH